MLPDLRAYVVRPTLPLDRADILEFCKRIWDGHDYIPYVFDNWLADPDGRMFTVEYGGHAVGLGRLTHLAPGEWWLEGLRVNPDHHDRHIGSLLHDFLNRHWDERGDGMLRLTTHKERVKVQHMCERDGYRRAGELTVYGAPAAEKGGGDFRSLLDGEVEKAAGFARRSPSLSLGLGMINLGWGFASPNARQFARAVAAGRAWWWRDGRGLLVGWDDEDTWEGDQQPVAALMAGALACALEDVPALLGDMTALAASLGKARAAWIADIHAEGALASASFRRIWDDSVYLYERGHPGRAG